MIIDDYKAAIRARGCSPKTIKTYTYWLWKYLRHLKGSGPWVDPRNLGERELEAWLSHLANHHNVSPTSQNCALQAVLFLLHVDLDEVCVRSPLEQLLGDPALGRRRPPDPPRYGVVG